MPTRKRRRPTSAADDGNAALPLLIGATELVSLEGFAILPAEVQQHIVDLSCLISASASPPTSRSLFFTDTPTAMSLCLASKGLNSLATPSLYRDVVITRPSALYFLQRTLKSHPERAKLTRRLHLGPLDALPEGWWPLTNAFLDGDGWQPMKSVLGTAYTWIKTSLSKAQLPSHYDENHSWALSRPLAGCREAAIREALQSAQAALDVNVRVEGQRIATSRVAAIMEVQAALDVYLESCKRVEDGIEEVRKVARPGARVPLQCRNGQCSHYCALDIWGTSHRCSRPWPPAGVYSCSRNDLLRHLARPGSPTDRFDHPLVFARSGFDVSVNPALGKGHQYHSTPGTGTHWRLVGDTFFYDEDCDWPDLASLQKDAERSWLWESDEDWAPRNEILINTGTIGQTLRLARSVLASLVNVEDLSLSGYLERVLDGKQHVSNVRRLSLGPPPPYWDVSISLAGLDRLEQLHLCEVPAAEGELRPIIDELFHLRKVYWSLTETFPRSYRMRSVSCSSKVGQTLRSQAELTRPHLFSLAWPSQAQHSNRKHHQTRVDTFEAHKNEHGHRSTQARC